MLVKKKEFFVNFFHDDRKPTLNDKFSTPKQVLEVKQDTALIAADRNFYNNT